MNYPDRHYCGGSWEAIWPHDPRYKTALECAREGRRLQASDERVVANKPCVCAGCAPAKKTKGNECVVVEYEIKYLPHETGDNKLKAIPVRKHKPAVDGNESR